MARLPVAQTLAILQALGFRVRSSAECDQVVRVFQATWLHGTALAVDGDAGPLTSAALLLSEARRRAGLGTASEHFSYSEFTCKCGGRHDACRRIVVERPLLIALEQLRAAAYPGGLSIVSGYRCAGHNAAVGGASSSQHLYGAAADVQRVAKTARVRALGVFTGIGYQRSSGLVQHVDTRGQGGAPNTSGASKSSPTTWVYS